MTCRIAESFVTRPVAARGIPGAAPLRWSPRRLPLRPELRLRSVDGDGEKSEEARMDEETLAKLRNAEEEAARLRQELSALRATQVSRSHLPSTYLTGRIQEKDEVLAKAGRTFWTGAPFDSKDLKRETMFESSPLPVLSTPRVRGISDAESGNWLSEADVDFLTGKEENGGQGLSPEAQAIVNDLLKECRPLVEDAEWEQVRVAIDRIINTPNKLKRNLESALTFLRTAEDRAKGRRMISDILEYIQEMDYNKYFEDRLNRKRFKGGAEEAKFVEFSLSALQTAESRLESFLALFPRKDLQLAKQKIAAVYE